MEARAAACLSVCVSSIWSWRGCGWREHSGRAPGPQLHHFLLSDNELQGPVSLGLSSIGILCLPMQTGLYRKKFGSYKMQSQSCFSCSLRKGALRKELLLPKG